MKKTRPKGDLLLLLMTYCLHQALAQPKAAINSRKWITPRRNEVPQYHPLFFLTVLIRDKGNEEALTALRMSMVNPKVGRPLNVIDIETDETSPKNTLEKSTITMIYLRAVVLIGLSLKQFALATRTLSRQIKLFTWSWISHDSAKCRRPWQHSPLRWDCQPFLHRMVSWDPGRTCPKLSRSISCGFALQSKPFLMLFDHT